MMAPPSFIQLQVRTEGWLGGECAPADAAAQEDHEAVHIRPTPEALVSIHDGVANLHTFPRHAMSSYGYRALRSGAMVAWREIAEPGIAA
jgi:hypothetical protein